MAMEIENLSNPGETPVDGDLVRITHDSGAVEVKQYFTPPPFVPPMEPDPPTPTPVLYAAAQLQIVGGDITGIGINSRFAAAFWADVGKYYVFFLEPLPDTSYMVMATAGPCNAYVLEEDKATDFFIITVTNAAGEPTDASSVNISIVRAI